ncbi:uncharacterized protein VTP21DRAFT_9122 [Calcarisporiella thermophila]|uniref:uncharacterized protein n=1 Tax=Calcarisporiella thermophila TaxID=911321 RepID=UPI0037432E49
MGIAETLEGSAIFRWYRQPIVQVSLLGFIFFCCPGLFNAINGMGAGGLLDENKAVVSNMNAVLNALFAIVGFMAGGINNVVGPRLTIFFSGWGYVIYIAALYSYQIHFSSGFNIAAGAILGICAGCIWAAQGALMMSYPTEQTKGRYISVFWSIFNWGGVIGSFVAFGINYNAQRGGSVTSSTYVTFMILMGIGTCCALLFVPPNLVRRADGSPAVVIKYPNWKNEAIEIFKLVANKQLMLLFPMFWFSNWFYAYQFSTNGTFFNVRTRALNSALYWMAQIVGSIIFGLFLDTNRFNRRTRAFLGLAIVIVSFVAIFAGGTAWQATFDRKTFTDNTRIDFMDSGRSAGPIICYLLYGLCDALYQVYCYWLMGALTNDPLKLSRYAGFYKGVQSAGAAAAWAVNAAPNLSMMHELAINWALLALSIPGALLVCRGVTDTNIGHEEYNLEAEKDKQLEAYPEDKIELPAEAAAETTDKPSH